MDTNNLKSKPNRCWGTKDIEEDDDALNVYNIPPQNHSKNPPKTLGSNKPIDHPSNTTIPDKTHTKKQKSKSKPDLNSSKNSDIKQSPSASIASNFEIESPRNPQKSSIDNKITELPLAKPKPNDDSSTNYAESIENKIVNNNPANNTFNSFQQTPPQPINQPGKMADPLSHLFGHPRPINQPYQPLLGLQNYFQQPPVHRFYPVNYLMGQYGNLAQNKYDLGFNGGNPSMRLLNNSTINANSSQSIQMDGQKTLYYQRLEVVDALFKFIIQILRTPETPSLEQVEDLKGLLDSLVVTNKLNENHLSK